jgi:hypothetical protein
MEADEFRLRLEFGGVHVHIPSGQRVSGSVCLQLKTSAVIVTSVKGRVPATLQVLSWPQDAAVHCRNWSTEKLLVEESKILPGY